MSETFQPRTCPSDQWKTWLRDGRTLFWRALPTWGVLSLAGYVLLGYAIAAWPVALLVVAAFSGILQIFHQVAMSQMMNGATSLSATVQAIGQVIRERPKFLLQTLAFRAIGVMTAFTVLALVYWLNPPASTPSGPALNEWEQFLLPFYPLYGVAFLPILVQLGGHLSAVLGLRRDGVSLDMARKLQLESVRKNILALMPMTFAILIGCFAVIACPLVVPFFVLYWMGVTECYYQDVFRGGYSIKARVRNTAREGVPHSAILPT